MARKTWLGALGTAMAGTIVLAACSSTTDLQSEPAQEAINQQAHSSECGGFPEPLSGGMGDSGEGLEYCDAEVLHWSYDAQSQELSLSDERIELNCCGLHDMVIEQQGGVYVVTETDQPDGYGRCSCMCVFDFALVADPIPEEVISIEIVRDVSDDGSDPQVVFSGELDLRKGSGSEVIDDTPSMWCEPLAS